MLRHKARIRKLTKPSLPKGAQDGESNRGILLVVKVALRHGYIRPENIYPSHANKTRKRLLLDLGVERSNGIDHESPHFGVGDVQLSGDLHEQNILLGPEQPIATHNEAEDEGLVDSIGCGVMEGGPKRHSKIRACHRLHTP